MSQPASQSSVMQPPSHQPHCLTHVIVERRALHPLGRIALEPLQVPHQPPPRRRRHGDVLCVCSTGRGCLAPASALYAAMGEGEGMPPPLPSPNPSSLLAAPRAAAPAALAGCRVWCLCFLFVWVEGAMHNECMPSAKGIDQSTYRSIASVAEVIKSED